MTKLKKIAGFIITIPLCFSLVLGLGNYSEVQASESILKDENPNRLEEITGMDENGNVFDIEDNSDGKVNKKNISSYSSRSTSDKIVNFRTKGNATTSYTEVSTGVSGYTNGAYGADAAYLGTSGGKVKFMLSGVVGQVNADQVQIVDFSSVESSSCYKVSSGRLLHYITQDMTTPGHATSLDNGPAPSYLKSSTTYYSYDGHYFYTGYSKMISDYQNNTRSNSVNKDDPYYNYYQYLPLRSKINYSSSAFNTLINNKVSSSSKMKNTASTFIKYQNEYGVNALVMAGVAGNESAWGTSSICKDKNNLFGLNAVDSSPGTSANTYASIDECIKQFAESYMSKGYLDPSDWRSKGGFLGNKGSGINVSYASDPYWGEKAANLAWTLDKNGSNKDYGKYTIGIKDTICTTHNSVNVRNNASTSSSSKILYNTGTHSNYAVLILNTKAVNSFYKIQSDAVLNSGRTDLSTSGKYDYDNMYAYISSDYVKIVHKGDEIEEAAKSLSSISITTPPNKISYNEGEKFDASGMVVKAKWSDGSTSDVTKSIKYSTDTLSVGTTSITIKYTYDGVTKSATQKIIVKENIKVTVDKVSVNPSKIDLYRGDSMTFGVSVTGEGNPSQSVKWSVSGENSSDTKISSVGSLSISKNESAETLTVKATSTIDTSKSAAATVNVKVKDDTPEVTDPDKDPSDNNEQGGSDIENPDENVTEDKSQKLEDDKNGIWVEGLLPENTDLSVKEIGKDNENYDELIEQVKGNTILGVYDISLSNELSEGKSIKLGFNVDEKYNGEDVIILHYKENDGITFTETYKSTVKDGKVSIDVSGFSPYVIALDDAENNTNTNGNIDSDKNSDTSCDNTGNKGTSSIDKNESDDSAGTDKNDGNETSSVSEEKSIKNSSDSVGHSSEKEDSSSNKDNVKSVKTADEGNLGLWHFLFTVSSISALTVMYILLKKKKFNK